MIFEEGGCSMDSGCSCLYHRYEIVHICPCGELISHSQGDWDEHRFHEGDWRTVHSSLYRHGDTAQDLLSRIVDYREVDA
jgi:hypothetical protein